MNEFLGMITCISFVFVVISVLYIFYIARNCRIASLSKMTMPLNKQSCSDQLFQHEFSLPNAGGAIHVINFTSLCYELHFQQHVETFNILLLHTKQIQICLIPQLSFTSIAEALSFKIKISSASFSLNTTTTLQLRTRRLLTCLASSTYFDRINS